MRLASFRGIVSRLLVLVVAGYLLFLFGRSAYRNWQINQRIRELELSITTLTDQNVDLKNLIAYYQTETFRELEARRKLGLKKPGEIIVSLPENTDTVPETITEQKEKEEDKPNWRKWWDFIFGS